MTSLDMKAELHDYLRGACEALVWKLDGLGEYDIRQAPDPDGHEPARPGQAQHGDTPQLLRRGVRTNEWYARRGNGPAIRCRLMLRPETRFVSVGRDRCRDEVYGDGPPFLFLKAFGASVDAIWEHPGHLRFHRSMGSAFRMVTFDHRGSGMSDALDEARQVDLDVRVEDVVGVLDALEIDRVLVCGELDGAFTAVKFADRVSRARRWSCPGECSRDRVRLWEHRDGARRTC